MTAFNNVGSFWRHYVPTYKSGSYTDFFVKFPWNENSRKVARLIRGISERRSTNRISSYVDITEIERVRLRLGRGDRPGSKTLGKTTRKSLSSHGDVRVAAIRKKHDHGEFSGSRYLEARRENFTKLPESKVERTKRARDVSIRFGVHKSGHGYGKERGDFCLVSAVLVGRKITFFYRSIELIGGLAFDLVLIREIERLLGVEFTEINIWAKKAFIFALKGNSNQKLYPKLREIMKNA